MSRTEFDQFVLREEVDLDELLELIDDYATIHAEGGKLQLGESYRAADTESQLLVPLLALHAFKKAGDVDDDAAIDAVELIDMISTSPGDAYPVLRELEQDGLVENAGRAYRIVPEKFERIRQRMVEREPQPAD